MGPPLTAEPWVLLLTYNLLVVWPIGRILWRAGLSPYLAVLVFIPLAGLLVVLAILGHSRWPLLPPRRPPPPRKARKEMP